MKRHIALMLCIACITGVSGCANPYQQETVAEQTAEKLFHIHTMLEQIPCSAYKSNQIKIEVKYENVLQM